MWKTTGARSELFSDFQIRVDGKTINTHKAVLATESEYFRVLFGQKDFIEAKKNLLTVVEFDYDTVKLLVDFLYTNRLELNEENIVPVLRCAHAYDVPKAMYKCAEYIEGHPISRYLEEISTLVPCVALDWIYALLLSLYDSYRSPVKDYDFDLETVRYELLRDLASREHIRVYKLHNYIISWYKHYPEHRFEQANYLFHHMDYHNQSNRDDFRTILKQSDLVENFNGFSRSLERAAYLNWCFENRKASSIRGVMRLDAPTIELNLFNREFDLPTEGCDFTIKIGEEAIYTHKAILMKNSIYFRSHQKEEFYNLNSSVTLDKEEHEPGIIENLVKLCYTNELYLDASNIKQTLASAHLMGFEEALYRCGHFVTFNCQTDYLFLISKLMPCPPLHRCYTDLIDYILCDSQRSRDELKLDDLTYNLIRDLTLYGQYRIQSNLMDLIIQWYQSQPASREVFFESLAHRMPINGDELHGLIKSCSSQQFTGLRRQIFKYTR